MQRLNCAFLYANDVKVSRTCFSPGIFELGLCGSVFECLSSSQTERWVFERWRFLDYVTHLNSVEIQISREAERILSASSLVYLARDSREHPTLARGKSDDRDVNFHCCGSNCLANGKSKQREIQTSLIRSRAFLLFTRYIRIRPTAAFVTAWNGKELERRVKVSELRTVTPTSRGFLHL